MQPAAVGCHLDRAVGESLGLTHSLALRLGLGLGRTGTRDLGGAHWDSLTHTHTHTSKHGEWRQGSSTLEGLGGGRSVGRSVGQPLAQAGCVGRSMESGRERVWKRWLGLHIYFGLRGCVVVERQRRVWTIPLFWALLVEGEGDCLSVDGGGCAGWGQRGCDKKIVDRAGSRHVESWSWTEPIFPNVPCCQRHGKT